MSSRPLKRVLIVDDETWVRNDLQRRFLRHNSADDGSFHFDVEVAVSIEEAIDRIRGQSGQQQFDVVVLDLSFTAAGTDYRGLRFADALGLYTRLGQAIPVTIVFSGFATIRFAVEAMRCGVWDVLDKKSTDAGPGPYQQVVDSAVSRLRALVVEQTLRLEAIRWTHDNIRELQVQYGGRVVAVWNVPEMRVVAHGQDAFELETSLHTWRKDEPDSSYPYVVWIPGQAKSKAGDAL